jgi:ferredoxin--NADP+ reductase
MQRITNQNKIVKKQQLNQQVKLLEIQAPDIAQKAKAGQFIILKTRANSERIPLTLASWNLASGTITLIFQEVGFSTTELGSLEVGEEIENLAGPLGNPSDIKNYGKVAVVCGGVGTAAAYPIAKALKEAGNVVVTIMGARNEGLLIFEEEMKAASNEFYIATDDGSKGQKGFVTDVLKSLIATGTSKFNVVYAVGPPMMMNAVSEATRPYKIKTIVSLNPIMVDGMGMCGACRVSVDDKVRFACVEGPEFDAHKVNFKELIMRLRSYTNEEKLTVQITANFGGACTCHSN